MACAIPPEAPTNKPANYARLCCLLVDVGSQALRETFDRIHPPSNLHCILASPSVHNTLYSLFKGKKKILTPAQWIKLYPAMPSSVSSASFDINLLLVLLKNICGLTPPPAGWDSYPPESYKSREADIVRLKCFGNTVYAYAEHASPDDETYNTHWYNIRKTLVRLGGATYVTAIDNLKTACMDPVIEEHYKELLQQWQRDDEYVTKADQLYDMRNDVKHMKEQLKILLESVTKVDANAKYPSSGTSTDYNRYVNTQHLLPNVTPVPFGSTLPPRQGREMPSEETDAFDSKEPDVDQSPSTDTKLPTSARTADIKPSKDLTSPAGEKDGTRSQDKSTGQTHMNEQKNISSAQAANYPRRCTAEVKSYKVEKIQTKGAQPVDKKSAKDLTSSVHQAAAVHYPVHSSRIGPNSEDALTGRGSSLATREQHNDHTAMCDMCMADSNSICKNCFRPVCGKCVEFFNTDLCSATKGHHNFVELKKKSSPISTDLEALSSQPGANVVNRETGSDNKTWSCSRCTFLNSPEHGICAICASSRGVNLLDQTEPARKVCRNCTFHNKADAKVCMQCGKTLDLSETVV